MSDEAIRRVRADVSQLDTNVMTRLLAEIDPSIELEAFNRRESDDPAACVVSHDTVPERLPCSREYWIAAAVARRLRAVPAAGSCESPGLERLIQEGQYANPRATSDGLASVGVLMFKPGVRVTPALLDEVQQRSAECGYIVAAARTIEPSIVRDRQLIRRHYQIHQEIAERGQLTARERVRLLDLYDRPAFIEHTGIPADRVAVVPVMRFLQETGIPVDELNGWSESTAEVFGLNAGDVLGANEIGDDKYVNLFVDPRGRVPPTFLLNPHMPSVIGWYERAAHPVCVCLLQAHTPDALLWPIMRSDFCGTTDPARARPGSLRRDSFEGLLPLCWEGTTNLARANNGIHLSSGPVEALREIAIWFDRQPENTALGRALGAAVSVSDLVSRSYFSIDGRALLVTEATGHCTVNEAVDLLRRGRLLGIESQSATAATLSRIDVARRHARSLASRADLIAVLATGSVARNRASEDSDLDLVIVAGQASEGVHANRSAVEGITVECEWMTPAAALSVAEAAEGDLKSLRESSRIGFGVPVFDPTGFHRQIDYASRRARPEQTSMTTRLNDIVTVVETLQGMRDTAASLAWRAIRGVLDNVAVVLLALHPLRYQKPKWVIDDLEDAGYSALAEALLCSYAIDRQRARASETIGLVAQILADLSVRMDLPGYEEMLKHGFLDQFPEFSFICRCLADAKSLCADRNFAGAEYTAKFAAGMAVAFSDDAAVREEFEGAPAYRALFKPQEGTPVDLSIVDACASWTARALAEYREVYGDTLHTNNAEGGGASA